MNGSHLNHIQSTLMKLHTMSTCHRLGVLTALISVSGVGKTTLMDVVASRKTGGYISGNIMISGYPKKQETFARISGYCEQNDIHSPHVTVYESLLYYAWLRLPSDVSSETQKMFIEEVMEIVELKSLRQALVGLPSVNGLSTEKRKRLTIAVKPVENSSIIFMDEPTSGSLPLYPKCWVCAACSCCCFYRERVAGMYSTLPYAVAQALIGIPYIFAQAAAYGVVVYAKIGFEWTAAKFFWYLFFMFFTLLSLNYYCMMAVAMTPNHHIAQIVSEDANMVEEFLRDYFGFKHDFLGVVAAINVGFTVQFAVIFAVSIMMFNFQKR
ncbi:hypothetical protein QYF36_000243 [Acer negundo]|nr:hypothetical protein QYF36_000243 [Acer negundo]